MDAMISIGGKVDKETTENLIQFIKDIFTVGFNTHMDQQTIQCALSIVQRVCKPENTTISGCNLTHKE